MSLYRYSDVNGIIIIAVVDAALMLCYIILIVLCYARAVHFHFSFHSLFNRDYVFQVISDLIDASFLLPYIVHVRSFYYYTAAIVFTRASKVNARNDYTWLLMYVILFSKMSENNQKMEKLLEDLYAALLRRTEWPPVYSLRSTIDSDVCKTIRCFEIK